MSLREIVQYSLWFLLYLVLQIFILRNVVLFNYSLCFIYVAGVLLLPAEVGLTTLILLGFFSGLFVDVFYNTLGMHAAATLLVAYLRPYWIQLQLEKGNTDRVDISLSDMGMGGYLTYLFPLILVHHSMLFFIEMSHFGMLGYTLLRIVASALFTTFLIVVIQLFTKR